MMESLGDGKWKCLECNYESGATNVKYHIEAKHLAAQYSYECHLCDTILNNRKALNNHLYRKHRDNKWTYTCIFIKKWWQVLEVANGNA